MSFEYIVEPDKKRTLSDDAASELAVIVGRDYDTYDDRRRVNLDQANELLNEIFFKGANTVAGKKEVGKASDEKPKKSEIWKTKVKMCKTYMFYCTLKAFIWKNIYANMNSMFDVSGENLEADNDSNKQKAMLDDKFYKMEFQKTCDKVIHYSLIYGELISFSTWKTKKQEYRRPISFFETLFKEDVAKLPQILGAKAAGNSHYIDEKVIYDNPYVDAVNPANIVYDAAQRDNWDSCPKIYKSYKTPEEIINNKYYKISKDVADDIRAFVDSTGESSDSQLDKDLRNRVTNGSTVEVLEHWGDLKLPDGTVLKNWHCVVVGRTHVVRFCKNKRIINPFTYGAYIIDPETGRAISPLYCVLSLANMQEELMNRTCDMQALTENPPLFAPRGFFTEEEIELYPGKIIEFGDSLNPAEIKPMQFASNIYLNDISVLSDLMAEVSGIFPNMAGADENKAKTATEISTKAQGQLTRLSMLIDTINQDFIIPVVKNVAKLCADFKSGEETILINNGNKKEVITIDDNIRQSEYRYTYSDRTASVERVNKADKVVGAAERFAQFVPLNGTEIYTWYMEQNDVENPERFIQQGTKMPQEVTDMLMQNPQVQQLCAAVEQAKQNGEPLPLPQQEAPQELPIQG